MTSAERAQIQYWWCVTTHWVVLLIGRAAKEISFNQSEVLPRLDLLCNLGTPWQASVDKSTGLSTKLHRHAVECRLICGWVYWPICWAVCQLTRGGSVGCHEYWLSVSWYVGWYVDRHSIYTWLVCWSKLSSHVLISCWWNGWRLVAYRSICQPIISQNTDQHQQPRFDILANTWLTYRLTCWPTLSWLMSTNISTDMSTNSWLMNNNIIVWVSTNMSTDYQQIVSTSTQPWGA